MANPFENESTRTVDRTPPTKEKQQKEQLIRVRVPAAGGGYTNIEIPKWQYDQLYQTGRMDIFPLTGFSTSYSPEAIDIAKQQHPEAYAEPTENVLNNLMFGGAGIYRAAANGALQGLTGTIRKWAPKMSFRAAYGNTPLATAGDAAMVAVPTGYEVNDLIQNGPTVENVTGSVLGLGGLAFEAIPTVMEGLQSSRAYNTFQLGRSLNKAINNYQGTTIPLNVGWGPKQTIAVTRAQRSTKAPLGFYPERWDVVSEGANPNGAWFQGQLGVPRTTPNKAIKAANARNLFAVRPVQLRGELTMEKPIVTIGDVPSRSALSYQAEQLGSDGIIYNNVYDNGYDANQVILAFNPESFNNTSRRFGQGTITTAEQLGFPKSVRNNNNLDWQQAIEDASQFYNSGRFRQKVLVDENGIPYFGNSGTPLTSGEVKDFVKNGIEYRYNPRSALTIARVLPEKFTIGGLRIPKEVSTDNTIYAGIADVAQAGFAGKARLRPPQNDVLNMLDDNGNPIDPSSFPSTLSRDVITKFKKAFQFRRPGSYVSGDISYYPRGYELIRALGGNVSKELQFNNSHRGYNVVDNIFYSRKPTFKDVNRLGLSTDSFEGTILLGQRPGNSLRYGIGFTEWNPLGVKNAEIRNAFDNWYRGKISLEEYENIYNRWVSRFNGPKLQFMVDPSGRKWPVHPHPYIYKEKNGGKLNKIENENN